MENQIIKLWAFYYNPMVWESASMILSYHRTKKGALSAMKKHKDSEKKDFDEMIQRNPEFNFKFGAHESWSVHKLELEILP